MDDETTRMLEMLTTGFPDVTSMTPLEAREVADARIRVPSNLDDVAETRDDAVIVGDRSIPVRIYHPHSPAAGASVMVYAHGGGFVHGSIAGHDGFCRRVAKGTGSTVVSVGYRLAPEHRMPAAAQDVADVGHWVADSGLSAGIVLAGDSAGATAAAQAAVMLRDSGSSICHGQVLLYPMLDPSMTSESYATRETGFFVSKRQLHFYWEVALGADPGTVPPDCALSPWFVGDLTGLPPTVVVTAGLDPLADEGREYASRLRAAGVPVLHRRYPDQFHGFLTIPDYGPAESARAELFSDIRSAFTKE